MKNKICRKQRKSKELIFYLLANPSSTAQPHRREQLGRHRYRSPKNISEKDENKKLG